MSTDGSQRTGLWSAAGTLPLWALVVLAVVTADPDDGANIGAGMVALLAGALSVVAAVLLLVSTSDRRVKVAGVVSLAGWAVCWLLPQLDVLPDGLLVAVFAIALASLLAAAAMTVRGERTKP
jgi:hypothetical protein